MIITVNANNETIEVNLEGEVLTLNRLRNINSILSSDIFVDFPIEIVGRGESKNPTPNNSVSTTWGLYAPHTRTGFYCREEDKCSYQCDSCNLVQRHSK